MKVLFVCRSNVGRSQMAMEFYNQLYPGDATSAGTMVDIPGQKLKERGPAVEVVLAMKELGIDMSENVRMQLSPEMTNQYDRVVVLAEPESIPNYLESAPNVEIWDVEDARGKTVEQAKVIRDQIKHLVEGLAKKLHQK
jgi:protein-tyrosine-phosphatase